MYSALPTYIVLQGLGIWHWYNGHRKSGGWNDEKGEWGIEGGESRTGEGQTENTRG